MSTITVDDLTDPHQLKQQYPSVNIIQDVYKQNVEVGHYVKLMYNGAYFWVKVVQVEGRTINGEIYHPLSFSANFSVGDFIIFQICYAFDIYDPYTFGLIPRIDQINS